MVIEFQSTLPMRGVTTAVKTLQEYFLLFQSTLPMRGVTTTNFSSHFRDTISIHTPHAGSDVDYHGVRYCIWISIHTPHAGSDCKT